MRTGFLFLLCLVLTKQFRAQPCDCQKEFAFVQQYMERNHPGLNSGTRATAAYKKGVAALRAEMEKARPDAACVLYLDAYLRLLKDHHITIEAALPKIVVPDASSSAAMDSFYKTAAFRSTPTRAVDTAGLIATLSAREPSGIEGLYRDSRGSLIAVVNEPGEEWNYKGIVVRSFSKFFPVGTIRFELRRRPDGRIWVSLLLPDRQRFYATATLLSSGLPNIGLTRVNQKENAERESVPYAFRMLDDKTAYIRVSSFNANLYQELKTFYSAIDSQVRARPYLVIDLRGNGGGSEANYTPLREYIYDRPLHTDRSMLFVTEENIKRYEESLAKQKQNREAYGQESIAGLEKTIALMKSSSLNRFVPYGEAATISGAVLPYPKKVVVLMDRATGSAAEGFLFLARQSKKVILMGENSGGFVGFGNVLPSTTPCFGYTLGNTTMKYSQLSRYEFTGLPPQVRLSARQDWVKEAQLFLKKASLR